MVILSTCNRVEIYAVASQTDFKSLEKFITEVKGIQVSEIEPHLYRLLDDAAVKHLFRVAAGLDSLVLGEPQILGQVMSAFELARSQDATGPILSRLFQSALHTGKRARSETAISHNPASISSVAIHLAEQVVPDLRTAQIGVVGAGEMAELAVEALRKRGVSRIQVVNRTHERARQLAERWGGESATYEELPQVLHRADILVTSTGAPHTIIHPETILPAFQDRQSRPLVIIDIAVPRDVDVEVGEIPGVRLYDIDRLHQYLENSLARRAHEVPFVESILEEEQAAFMNYMRTLDVIPLIAEMRQQAEAIRQAELEKTLRRMSDLTPEERQRLEALTQALVKKILHTPITRLRSESGTPLAASYAAAARNLFGLDATQ
jgi:glutamyl-tRNA reductase